MGGGVIIGTMKRFIVIMTIILVVVATAWGKDVEPPAYPYPEASITKNFFIHKNIGYYIVQGNIYGEVKQFINAIAFFESQHTKKHIVIYLTSPGGSVFDGLAFAQLMLEAQREGWIVEVRAYGWAASAAAIVLACGTPGHRYIADNSFVMIHELSTLKMFSMETVSDTEKEARVKRLIQNEVMSLLASHTRLSRDELIKKCREETWMCAQTAVEWGFADHIGGE